MFSGVVIAIVCLPALLSLVWFSEVVAGCLALRKDRTSPAAAPGTVSHRTAVLIPAHNEGAGILPTIRDVQAQLGPDDSILVVADNCTDDTAAIVQAAGVEVTVRADPVRRGKGYALEFGVRLCASSLPTSLSSWMPIAALARMHCGHVGKCNGQRAPGAVALSHAGAGECAIQAKG